MLSSFVEGRPDHLSYIAASRKRGHGTLAPRHQWMDHCDRKPRCTAGLQRIVRLHCFVRLMCLPIRSILPLRICFFGERGRSRSPEVHPIPGNVRRGHGGGSLRVFRQFSGLKLVPSKQRYLVPPTSPLRGCYATGTDYCTCQVRRDSKTKSADQGLSPVADFLFLETIIFCFRECFARPISISLRCGFQVPAFFIQANTSSSNPVLSAAPVLLLWRQSVWVLCRAQTV